MSTASHQYHINPNDFIDKRKINTYPAMYRDMHGHRQVVPAGKKVVRKFKSPWPQIIRDVSGEPVIRGRR